MGDKHSASIGQGFDACGDIDAVAIEVVALDDHVAEIDADAQLDEALRLDTHLALGHCLLHLDRAAHRIDDAGKLHQHTVAGGLDDAAVVSGDLRIEELMAQLAGYDVDPLQYVLVTSSDPSNCALDMISLAPFFTTTRPTPARSSRSPPNSPTAINRQCLLGSS